MSISITIMTNTMPMLLMMIAMGGCHDAYEENRDSRSPDILLRFLHFKEPEERVGYVEHCRITNLRKEQLGHVNVLAFLDPSWYYSYKQAIMLELLKNRLEKSGFSNILYFVITPRSNSTEDNAENSLEMQVWKEISKNMLESDRSLLATEATLFSTLTEQEKGIILLQDTPELGIWEDFHAAKDEVVIVDQCGKLTYQFVMPFSILHFPYVKAAILSTYKEDPCGPCDEKSSTVHDSLDYEEYLLKNINSNETKMNKNLDTSTKRTFTDLDTTTMSSEKLKIVEADKNINVSLNVNESKSIIYNITTETTESTVQVETTQSTKDDNVNESTVFTDRNIEITTEVPLEQEATQDYISLNEQTSGSNSNIYLTTNYNQDKLNTSLESSKGERINADVEYNEAQIEQKDKSIPLRIILYSPHLHKENGTFYKYTHLVLKTGYPNYHDHFNSKSTTSDQELDSTTLNDKKLAEYVHGVNESPGVYGEIADYWQTTETDEFNNENENTEYTDYDYATVKNTESNVYDAADSKNNVLKSNVIDTIDINTNNKSDDKLDDFMQRRLIEHYSKLLTWIGYHL